MKTRHLLAQKAPASTCPVRRRLGGLYAPELLEARIAPATIIVTSLIDPTEAGKVTLRDAVNQANGNSDADTIVFKLPDPLLPHTITLDPILGGDIDITNPLTIKGPGIDLLTISGSDMIRIFNIDDSDAATLSPTTISGLTLTDGTDTVGGAIRCYEPLTLKNVVVRGSYASVGRGGGIFVYTSGKVSIVSSRIVHNESVTGAGGVFLHAQAGISLVKTTIADNIAPRRTGFQFEANGPLANIIIDGCVISNHTTTGTNARGGGGEIDGSSSGTVIIKNSFITGNTATGGGGGVFLYDGNLTVSKSTFSNNTALTGGAIGTETGDVIVISGSRFLGNSATGAAVADKGGGALFLQGPATVKISGSLFSGNTSARDGGAISNKFGVVKMDITGSSFLGNTSFGGGGALFLLDGTVLTMKGSILSGNVADGAGGAVVGDFSSVLKLTGNKFTENRSGSGGGAIFIGGGLANAATANLSGNLFQANVSANVGGAIAAIEDSIFTSKSDKFIGNVAQGGAGGGAYLDNTGASTITGSLFQGNVAGGSGGGIRVLGFLTLTSVKVLENITGSGGLGGGIRIAGGAVIIAKSVVTGNVAADGGGILYNAGTLGIDAATRAKVKGNASGTDRKNIDQF